LLWSAMPDVKPRQNLRAVLPEVRYLIGSHIRIERQTN
jgi:DNA-binding SARP family transcriptional activator